MKFLEFMLGKTRFIVPILIIIALIHLITGKFRWQYYPVYFLGLLYFFLIILNYFNLLNSSSLISKIIIATGIISIFISAVFLIVLPKEKLPIPTGKYNIGTRVYDLEDKSRDEIYSDDRDDKRKIKYQIWYPTDLTTGYKRSKWISDGVILTRQLATNMHLPFFMLDHTAEINSNSYNKAPLSKSSEKYPIVVISHGWKGFRELHTDYAEELASNGFIAVSIDHTYGSQAVKFKDGEVAYINKEALPSTVNPSSYDNASNLLITSYGKDVASTLDDLENLNNISEDFKGRFDLERIGLLGHSTGGGGDVYISIKDKRIKALLALDAWVNPLKDAILEKGLSMPALFLRSEQWSKGPNNNGLNTIIENSKNSTLIQMNKTNHVDFSMSYMYSPLTKYVGFTGGLGGRVSSEIQREVIAEFFDKNLKNYGEIDSAYLMEIVEKYEALELIK